MDLLDAYRVMAVIRAFEERTMAAKTAGLVPGSVHLCNGQEAIPVGACATLEPDDPVTATYRGHGWAIAKGVPLVELFAEIMGRESALCGGRAGSPYLSSAAHAFLGENSIVGAGVPIALGAALATRYDGSNAVSMVTIGDGALSQGAAHEAINMAAAFRLPLVIVVENNVYSEMTPVADMVAIDSLATRAVGYGIPAVTVDGNDVEAVEAAAAEAVARARTGQGPTMIEAMTERLVGHYSGDAQHYRPPGEVESAAQREPLARLRQDDRISHADRAQVDAEVAAAVEHAFEEAAARPEPSPTTALEHVYG